MVKYPTIGRCMENGLYSGKFYCVLDVKDARYVYLTKTGQKETFDFKNRFSYVYATYDEAEQVLSNWIANHPEEWAEMVAEKLSA